MGPGTRPFQCPGHDVGVASRGTPRLSHSHVGFRWKVITDMYFFFKFHKPIHLFTFSHIAFFLLLFF